VTHAAPPQNSNDGYEPDLELTVDQLAERTGVSVRNIRFYAGKGLLPAPKLRGRVGLYGPNHLARLELISELSALGFTLSAIEGYLARLPERVGPVELELQRALLVPWVPERLEEISIGELTQRAGRTLSDDELDLLESLGAIERRPDGAVVVHGSPALNTALASIETGLPPEALRRIHTAIELHTTALAEELMKLFQADVLQPYRDRGKPASERAKLGELYSRMKPMAVQGVVTAFGRAVNRAIRERFSEG
jgi:DNA-binding transcriptional MerR regulator